MSVFKLSWKDGSISYINVDGPHTNDVQNLVDAMKTAELKWSELKYWWKVQLEMNPCGDAIILKYGHEERECFAIPVKRLK